MKQCVLYRRYMVDLSEEGGIESLIKKDIWKYLAQGRFVRYLKPAISCNKRSPNHPPAICS